MAKTNPDTILLNGRPRDESRQFEDYQISSTGSAVTPGYLLEVNAANEKVQAHSTAGGLHPGMVALEDPMADTTGQAIDYNWATGDTPRYIQQRPGDELYMYIKSDATIDHGDYMESAGDGTLQEHTADTVSGTASLTVVAHQVNWMALEDISSTTGAKQRIKVRVI